MTPTPPSGSSIITNCEGLGPFCKLVQAVNPIEAFKALAIIITNLIGVLTISAGLWFIAQFMLGAIMWISSGGDKQALENARNRITHAFLGLLIVVASIAIIGVVGSFLELDILFCPNKVLCQLDPTRPPGAPACRCQ